MKFYLKFIVALLFLSLFSCSGALAHAQAPSSLDGMDISITPQAPAPGESVTVELQSFSTDLNAASIIWTVGGKVYAQGVGIASIKTVAPMLGKTTTVLATIMTAEKREIKKSIIITSGGVDLVWEGGGYVPPFYKGKALFVYQTSVRIMALPHLAGTNGLELDPKTLVYKWTVNDKVVQNQSGYGRQTLNVKTDIPRPLYVLVEVGTKTGTQKAESSIALTPGDPSISFYEDDPLYGVLYNQAIFNKITLSTPEITMRAVPFNFNTLGASYVWSINSLERGDLSKNQSITLRTKEGATGNSEVTLDIRNVNDILQGARSTVGIYFNKK